MPDFDLTIVIEMDTKEITGGVYDYYASLREWLKQADALYPRKCEVVVSSSYDHKAVERLSTPHTPVRNVCTPGASYYGLKNAGAAAALGGVVLFSDSDCRPCANFLESVLKVFEDPKVLCAAGRTKYDGEGLLTRMNTASSFGYLHQGDRTLLGHCALSHNVAVRSGSWEGALFGPFNGRMGGDVYMTEEYRKRGEVPIVPGMVIYHEDPTWSLRGLLDRHLRDMFYSLKDLRKDGRWPGFWRSFARVMRSAFKRPKRQFRKIRKFGSALGVHSRHYPFAVLMLTAHFAVGVAASLVILLTPGLRQRWLNYQFGPSFPEGLKC
jgi:hypothetical protein